MSEARFNQEPAQTYQLNVLASALGRFAVPGISRESSSQAVDLCERVIDDILEGDKPPVPHTNQSLLIEAEGFDSKLLHQLTKGPAVEHMSRVALQACLDIVKEHSSVCRELRNKKSTSTEMMVTPQDISDGYGLSDLWANATDIVQEEAHRWGEYESHPDVGYDLIKKVELGETKDMMRSMWRHVIGAPRYPEVNTYLTDATDLYHVYWAPTADKLDYATPKEYDRATQLSFDLPHNATHLAHLDAMDPGLGVFRYDDNMESRAYFEAVTVFSEYKALKQAEVNLEFIEELSDILQLEEMSSEKLASWMVRDRGYEFKLRAARYAADIFMINGVDFFEAVNEISRIFSIPVEDAEKETKKYLPWTGLGAVYSFGYRKLQENGVSNVYDAIVDANGNAITKWKDTVQ